MNRNVVGGFGGWRPRDRVVAVMVRFMKGCGMITNEVSDGLAGILRTAIVELVRRDGPDLSARQLGVFLTCYLETEAQTVRGLAAKLGVSKPAITRALDRLSEFDLVRRKTDPLDRRSVLVQRTATGMAFLRELRTILRDAAAAMRISAEPQGRQRAGTEVRAH
jgi:DNA-binding MarR family transcriptional regulator